MSAKKRIRVEVANVGTFTCDQVEDIADGMARLRRLNESAWAAAMAEEGDGDITVYPRVPTALERMQDGKERVSEWDQRK